MAEAAVAVAAVATKTTMMAEAAVAETAVASKTTMVAEAATAEAAVAAETAVAAEAAVAAAKAATAKPDGGDGLRHGGKIGYDSAVNGRSTSSRCSDEPDACGRQSSN
ncbi:MAG: hypothetical protein J2P53_14100 [Bradyrhizobiaceae bacterium]|nr:hypothetical protein [Bradyrhizobiaceae bacterium]